MTDHSASNSDEDVNMDLDDEERRSVYDSPMEEGGSVGFTFGEGGSGGFGFGPGAEEDDFEQRSMAESSEYYECAQESVLIPVELYPSINLYPSKQGIANLGHHPNRYPYATSIPAQLSLLPKSRPASPLTAQAYSTTLAAPVRLLQPAMAMPLSTNASEVEKARAMHGPQCKSIPKLVMSQYGNEQGEKSMWTVCGDCGAAERAA
jgi:hypothetical protein